MPFPMPVDDAVMTATFPFIYDITLINIRTPLITSVKQLSDLIGGMKSI